MAFVIKTKPVDDVCPGQLLESINSDPVFNGAICYQIIDTADGNWTFEFDRSLTSQEDSDLDSKLAAWSCTSVPVDDGDYALDDAGGPATDIIWSSDKIDSTYIAIGDSISELGDVDATGAQNNYTLLWNSATNKFVAGQVLATIVGYDNTTSGMTATTVQDAIDEVDSRIDSLEGSSHTHSNKTVLDSITSAGSGQIITSAERTLLNSAIQPTDSVGDLSDVDITGITNDQLLIWDTAANGGNGGFVPIDKTSVGTVTSVNGQTGVVVLDTDDISEGTTNLYFTNTRADARVTFETLDTNGDVGTGTDQVAKGDHNHAGVYEPADPTIIKESEVHDTPVDGATVNPISSNWAYDHTDPGVVVDPHTQYQLESEKGAANGYTPLDTNAKVPTSYLPDSITSGVIYKGTWDANTNTPDLININPDQGDYYVVNVAGNTNLDGITDWNVGDWAIYNGTVWEKVDNTESVTSVFGRSGDITAQAGDYDATLITNTPSGNIAAITVQAALNELDSEKVAKSGDRMTGDLNFDQHAVTFTISGDTSDSSKIVTGTSSLDVISSQDVKLSGTGIILDVPGNNQGYYIEMGSNGQITFVAEPTTTWGNITGTLSNQTDLQNALDGKSDTGHTHTATEVSYNNSGTNISATDVQGAITELDGDLTTIGGNKADKVSGATSGNLAGLDANGNLTDSGIASSDVVVITDSIDVLADVDTTTSTPSTDDVLAWDGTNWVPSSNAANKKMSIFHNGSVTQTIGTTTYITLLFGSSTRTDAPVTYSSGTITFNETGQYTITFEISTTGSGNSRSATEIAAFFDGSTTPMAGSKAYNYDRRSSRGESTSTSTIYVNVTTTGQTLDIKAKALTGNTITLQDACRLIVEKG